MFKSINTFIPNILYIISMDEIETRFWLDFRERIISIIALYEQSLIYLLHSMEKPKWKSHSADPQPSMQRLLIIWTTISAMNTV